MNSNSSQLSRVFDLLPYIRDRYPGRTVFACRKSGRWSTLSTEEYSTKADLLSYALMEKGIGKGDRIVTITPNRPEFNIADMGMLQLGAVHVPAYSGLTDEKLFNILSATACKAIFLSGKQLLQKILSFKADLPSLQLIVSFDALDNALNFDDLLRLGETSADPVALQKARDNVKPNDPASVIYISGATTPVKGVVLTHQNHVSNLTGYAQLPHFRNLHDTVSLLPLAHSFERTINYCQQYFGLTVWYNEKLPGMIRDFAEVKPETLVMVPLLVERLFGSLEQQTVQKETILSKLGRKGIAAAKRLEPGQIPALKDVVPFYLAKWLIFPGWRKTLGGNLKFILCGGAALEPNLLNLAFAAGIPIFEGYGITEAGPLVSYNHQDHFGKYTVGKPMPGVSVKIDDDGEVLVKSEGVMAGYLDEEKLSVIDNEGWLHTGDLGVLDTKGYLSLTGIKKDIFKLSSGLYVSPGYIEEQLKQSGFIRNAWVYGHNRNHLVAVLVPDLKEIYLKYPGMKQQEITGKAFHQSLDEILSNEVRIYNNRSRGPDQVLRFCWVSDEWSVENGLLSPEKTLNRGNLLEKYAVQVSELYA